MPHRPALVLSVAIKVSLVAFWQHVALQPAAE